MWQLLPLCIVLLTWEIANCMSEVSVSNLVRMLITGCPIINSTDCNVITIIFVSIYNWSFLNTKQIIIQILRRMKYNFFRWHYTLLYRNISPFCEPLSFVQELHLFLCFAIRIFLLYFIRTFTLYFRTNFSVFYTDFLLLISIWIFCVFIHEFSPLFCHN